MLAYKLFDHDFEWSELEEKYSKINTNRNSIINKLKNDKKNELFLPDKIRESWNVFHENNKGNFYKPRKYLYLEFPQLIPTNNEKKTIFEVGCGYGSSLLPLLINYPTLYGYGCDISEEAIRLFQKNPKYNNKQCSTFVYDVTDKNTHSCLPNRNSIDVILLIFVLSSIPPNQLEYIIEKLSKLLKPGGYVCIRDYGLYDLAMIRSENHLDENLYYRKDGTLAYFFTIEKLHELFITNDNIFKQIELKYCTVLLKNYKKKTTMNRVWIHGIFQKIK